MKEIIVKRDGTCITMLEIVDNILRLNIEDHECNYNMDFTLEEIDDLQEAISIMKDKLQRNLSNKKDIVTPTEQKDANIVSNDEQKDAENVSDNEKKLVYGGEIADFPVEIVEKMLEYQVLQGYARNVSVFEKYKCSGGFSYGFNWDNTNEGKDFWYDVILNKNFALFFERYPKKQE